MRKAWTRALVALTILGVVAGLLGFATTTAGAHTGPAPLANPAPLGAGPTAAVSVDELPAIASPPPAVASLVLLLVVTVALGAAVVSPRRTLVLALALVLVVLVVESAVHSVHHLADRQGAPQCAIASAAAHVQGASPSVSPEVACITAPVGAMAVSDVDRPGGRALRPDEGRAPPTA